jgi:hypothetical protein
MAQLGSEDSGDEGTIGRNGWRIAGGSVANGTAEPRLRIEAVSRQFRDRSVGQEAEGVEEGESVDLSMPIHQECKVAGRSSAEVRSAYRSETNQHQVEVR